VGDRTVWSGGSDDVRPVIRDAQRPSVVANVSPGDMAMGAALAGVRAARRGLRLASRVSAPGMRVVMDPPLVPQRWRLSSLLLEWGREWQADRDAVVRNGVEGATVVAAHTAEVVLPLVDLTPVVHDVLERLDLDLVVTQALARLDLVAVVNQALDELDTGQVLDVALREVDLTQIVVDQVDLGRVVSEALEQLDLTSIVLSRVDLGAVVTEALDTLDLTAVVRDRVDLAGIAEDVIQEIDLPAIIQESTGSVASEAVVSARLAGVDADDAISRVADRLLFRVRGRRAESHAKLEGEVDEERPTETKSPSTDGRD
jgi:hypothetical protein